MKRGAVSKSQCKLVGIWFPLELLPVIDDAVQREDTDRSKFVRNAVREKLANRTPNPRAK
jgi:metal-responsive CopG/Arc/MetJ family transcriptional regulator